MATSPPVLKPTAHFGGVSGRQARPTQPFMGTPNGTTTLHFDRINLLAGRRGQANVQRPSDTPPHTTPSPQLLAPAAPWDSITPSILAQHTIDKNNKDVTLDTHSTAFEFFNTALGGLCTDKAITDRETQLTTTPSQYCSTVSISHISKSPEKLEIIFALTNPDAPQDSRTELIYADYTHEQSNTLIANIKRAISDIFTDEPDPLYGPLFQTMAVVLLSDTSFETPDSKRDYEALTKLVSKILVLSLLSPSLKFDGTESLYGRICPQGISIIDYLRSFSTEEEALLAASVGDMPTPTGSIEDLPAALTSTPMAAAPQSRRTPSDEAALPPQRLTF